MTRILRLSLVALVLCALGSPAFAFFCTSCGPEGYCEVTPGSGTRCLEHIDYCEDFSASCNAAAAQSLAEQLTVASVEVTTPNGLTKTDAAPRVAQLAPLSSTR